MRYTSMLTATLLFVPIATFAATGDLLIHDATKVWESTEQQHIADEARDIQQEIDESSSELFPEIESTSSQGTIDTQKSSRISGYISAVIDGSMVTFGDVPRDTWFAPYVRDIAEQGIVSGYRDENGKAIGQFGPADNVTIAQLSKIALAASSNLGNCPSVSPLNSTASGTWASSYISCSEHLKWALYSDGSIDIHRNANRAEVITTLLEAFRVTIGEPTGTAFTDVTASTLFNPVIEQAKKDGIVSGYTDTDGNATGIFGPDDAVTRAELSKMVVLAMQVYRRK